MNVARVINVIFAACANVYRRSIRITDYAAHARTAALNFRVIPNNAAACDRSRRVSDNAADRFAGSIYFNRGLVARSTVRNVRARADRVIRISDHAARVLRAVNRAFVRNRAAVCDGGSCVADYAARIILRFGSGTGMTDRARILNRVYSAVCISDHAAHVRARIAVNARAVRGTGSTRNAAVCIADHAAHVAARFRRNDFGRAGCDNRGAYGSRSADRARAITDHAAHARRAFDRSARGGNAGDGAARVARDTARIVRAGNLARGRAYREVARNISDHAARTLAPIRFAFHRAAHRAGVNHRVFRAGERADNIARDTAHVHSVAAYDRACVRCARGRGAEIPVMIAHDSAHGVSAADDRAAVIEGAADYDRACRITHEAAHRAARRAGDRSGVFQRGEGQRSLVLTHNAARISVRRVLRTCGNGAAVRRRAARRAARAGNGKRRLSDIADNTAHVIRAGNFRRVHRGGRMRNRSGDKTSRRSVNSADDSAHAACGSRNRRRVRAVRNRKRGSVRVVIRTFCYVPQNAAHVLRAFDRAR